MVMSIDFSERNYEEQVEQDPQFLSLKEVATIKSLKCSIGHQIFVNKALHCSLCTVKQQV